VDICSKCKPAKDSSYTFFFSIRASRFTIGLSEIYETVVVAFLLLAGECAKGGCGHRPKRIDMCSALWEAGKMTSL